MTKVLIIFLLLLISVNSKILPIVNEVFEDCNRDGETERTFNFSELKFKIKSKEMFIDGKLKFNKELSGPWTVKASVEKNERGTWLISFLNRYIQDFCQVIKQTSEIWYPITKYVKQNCPFQAGVN